MEKHGRAGQAIDDNIMLSRKLRYLHVVYLGQKIEARTFIIFNTYCSSVAKIFTRTRFGVTLYVHRLTCFHVSQSFSDNNNQIILQIGYDSVFPDIWHYITHCLLFYTDFVWGMFQFAYTLPRQSSAVLCSNSNPCDYPGKLYFTVSQLNVTFLRIE